MGKYLLFGLLAASVALGQSLEFEVAKIALSQPFNAQAIVAGAMKVGLNVTGQRVEIGYLSIPDLAAIAYEVKPLDVTGPDWMRQQRFDISALMPEGTTKEQLPQMMQSLLKDRFKLVAHKDTKEQQMFGLEVAKGGHKMKEAAPETEKPADAPPANPANLFRANAGGGGTLNMGGQKVSVSPDGNIHFEIERLTMAQMAQVLSTFVGAPVVDRTNLSGAFQLGLDLTQSDLMPLISRLSAATGGAIPANALGAVQGAGLAGTNAADPGGTIVASIQKLGLRLEKTKGPVTVLVIESAEKMPSEN